MGRVIPTDRNTEGRSCRNCGLPLRGDCVSAGEGGGQHHARYYCVGCGVLLGFATMAEVASYYAGGQATVDLTALSGYFERLRPSWWDG